MDECPDTGLSPCGVLSPAAVDASSWVRKGLSLLLATLEIFAMADTEGGGVDCCCWAGALFW